jgi:hypothetical protein
MATRIIRPAGDVTVNLVAGNPNDTAGQRYQNIDEAAWDPNDYIYSTIQSVAGDYRAAGDILVGDLGGGQIVSVQMNARASRGAGAANQSCELELRASGTTDFQSFALISAIFPGGQAYTFTWTTNPGTGVAWTAADVEAFRVGGSNSFGARLYTDDIGNVAGLLQAELVVTYNPGNSVGMIPIR